VRTSQGANRQRGEKAIIPDLCPVHIYNADATQLWLLSQASKQRVVCAQQRDVTMLMTSLRCHPRVPRQLTPVELRRRLELDITCRRFCAACVLQQMLLWCGPSVMQ